LDRDIGTDRRGSSAQKNAHDGGLLLVDEANRPDDGSLVDVDSNRALCAATLA
jgi:hypothetical protein